MSKQLIHGTAAAGAAVRVVDRSGAVLAETKADGNGNWEAGDMPLMTGDVVRAEITESSGRHRLTDWLTIEAEEPEETAIEREYREMFADEDAAWREKWEGVYAQVVEALADGGDCDYVFLTDLLAALGKTTEDLSADIDLMSNALASAAIHDRCARAKLNSLGERSGIF